MIKRILVPTDGSALSERAFPVAVALAQAQDAEVALVRVVLPLVRFGDDPAGYVPRESYDEFLQAATDEASYDLARAAKQLRESGISVRTEILYGSTAATLLDFEATNETDLVVMSTHGRTGLARFTLGSVADLILREGIAPVLLVRPFGSLPSRVESALIPLDGSLLAEQALPIARQLAGRPLRRLHLLRVIAGPSEREAADSYLSRIAAQLSPYASDVTVAVEEDLPSRAIARATAGLDLIILSTLGRGGLDRLRHGSVADEATHRLSVPTLLVRADVARTSRATAAVSAAVAGI